MAESPPPRPDASALLLAGHGSAHPEGADAVRAHAAEIRGRGVFAAVHVAFWKEPPFLCDALASIDEAAVYVVPVLAAHGHITEAVIPRELGLDPGHGRRRRAGGRQVVMCDALGTHPGWPRAVADEIDALAAAEGLEPPRLGVLLVGHGNPRNPASAERVDEVARRLDGLRAYAEVRTAFLENAPFMVDWTAVTDAADVAVLPYMISGGRHAAVDVPDILGLNPAAPELRTLGPGKAWAGPFEAAGRRVWYMRPIGSRPAAADMILDLALAAAAATA